MIAFVLTALIAGAAASLSSLFLGASIWGAFGVYVATGFCVLGLAFLRALVCATMDQRGESRDRYQKRSTDGSM